MLIREIITSCSNASVAQAALASIGGHFAERIEARAARLGLEAGAWAADIVRGFASTARSHDMARLSLAISGHDQPVLAGLRHILETGLVKAEESRQADMPASAIALREGQAGGAWRTGFCCQAALG